MSIFLPKMDTSTTKRSGPPSNLSKISTTRIQSKCPATHPHPHKSSTHATSSRAISESPLLFSLSKNSKKSHPKMLKISLTRTHLSPPLPLPLPPLLPHPLIILPPKLPLPLLHLLIPPRAPLPLDPRRPLPCPFFLLALSAPVGRLEARAVCAGGVFVFVWTGMGKGTGAEGCGEDFGVGAAHYLFFLCVFFLAFCDVEVGDADPDGDADGEGQRERRDIAWHGGRLCM